jgi:hypothetical protein
LDFLLSHDFWEGVQAFLTSTAILVGGIWFLSARRHYPRADVNHEIWSWKTNADEKLVRVVIKVENRGEVLLQLGRTIVRLHQVLPVSEELSTQIRAVKSALPGEKSSLEWRPYYEQITDWELLGGELEPGESDEISFHFVLPAEVETVMVFSFLGNKRKMRRPMPRGWVDWWRYVTDPDVRKREFGWSKSSVHVL